MAKNLCRKVCIAFADSRVAIIMYQYIVVMRSLVHRREQVAARCMLMCHRALHFARYR